MAKSKATAAPVEPVVPTIRHVQLIGASGQPNDMVNLLLTDAQETALVQGWLDAAAAPYAPGEPMDRTFSVTGAWNGIEVQMHGLYRDVVKIMSVTWVPPVAVLQPAPAV